jgi:hypothetical protein
MRKKPALDDMLAKKLAKLRQQNDMDCVWWLGSAVGCA